MKRIPWLIFLGFAMGCGTEPSVNGNVGTYTYFPKSGRYMVKTASKPVRVEAPARGYSATENAAEFKTPWFGDAIVVTDAKGNRDCVYRGEVYPGGQWNGTGCGGLVAWYPLNGDANDYSDYENHGIVFGAVPTAKGYRFDGDDYIDLGDPPHLGFVDQFTVAAWVRPNKVRTYMGIVGKMYFKEQRDGMHGWMLYLGQTGGTLPPAQYRFTIGDGGWPPRFSESPFTWFDNEWRHAVAVKDGFKTRVYVDGNRVGGTTLRLKNCSRRGGSCSIGKQYSFHGENPMTFWRGLIGDVKIWNYVLSEEEIRKEYESVRNET